MNHALADSRLVGNSYLNERDREDYLDMLDERRAELYAVDVEFIEACLHDGMKDCGALARIISQFICHPSIGNASELAGAMKNRIESEAFDYVKSGEGEL